MSREKKLNFEVIVEGVVVNYKKTEFPAGELQVSFLSDEVLEKCASSNRVKVVAKGALDSEGVIELIQLLEILTRYNMNGIIILAYMPYSRQDRVVNPGESFALKVFAKMINSFKTFAVVTTDAHSDVTEAVFDRIVNIKLHEFNSTQFIKAIAEADYLVSPDAGAFKKIFKLGQKYGKPVIVCGKARDNNGNITHTDVYGCTAEMIHDSNLLIVDDICEGGRTFIEIARAIKAINPMCVIDVFTTHGFYSKGVDVLKESGITTVYTTHSVTNALSSEELAKVVLL